MTISNAAKRMLRSLKAGEAQLRFGPRSGEFTIQVGGDVIRAQSRTVAALARAQLLSRLRGDVPVYVINPAGRRMIEEMSE